MRGRETRSGVVGSEGVGGKGVGSKDVSSVTSWDGGIAALVACKLSSGAEANCNSSIYL